jgi:hypothetical protein
MHFEITFDGDSFDAKIGASEEVTVEGVGELLQALVSHPSWQSGMSVLVDATGVTLAELAAEDIRRISELFAEADSRLGPGSWAIVTGTPAAYGLGRMWQTLLEPHSSLRSHIFSSVEEARHWLRHEATDSEQ